ncbi:hypothetical protein ABEB36_006330 [Hypothenemus hampei]|uniref:Exonuclease domain-containing protein n=1 Tax=Hypothenemus hampei TaxID=57062 RepID=A0ABD1EQ66_HYPHA
MPSKSGNHQALQLSFPYLYSNMASPLMSTNTKRRQRIENKKKKLAAFLDIAKLNENDRRKQQENKTGDELKCVQLDENGLSPSKKIKTELENIGPSGKTKLSGQEYIDLKKVLKERKNKILQVPKFQLRDMGEGATLKVSLDSRYPLFLSDIQHLILYSQIGVHSPYSPARWCSLEKYNKLDTVLLLIVENLSLYDYEAFESHFPFCSSTFDHKIEILSPFAYSDDIVKELSMVPLSATQMKRLIHEYGTLEEATKHCNEIFNTFHHYFPIDQGNVNENTNVNSVLPSSDKFDRTRLLLSGWQMVEENFPLPIKGLMERKYSDYTLTKNKYKKVTKNSPLIAVDCEMCKTETGDLELTRVSIVNEQHQVIYDTLVKPQNRIVDYLTRYSGINKKMMANVNKQLTDVQKELRKLLPNDAILVGQSLANDLHALKMMHPYVIDTSVIFNVSGDRQRKTKLKILANEFLNVQIQSGNKGHCSSEDSLACMKLVQLKLKKHLYYGDAVMNSIYTQPRAYPDLGTSSYALSMWKQCVKSGNTVNLIAQNDTLDKYKYYLDKNLSGEIEKIECTKVESNVDVVEQLNETMNQFQLNVGHLKVELDDLGDTPKTETFKIVDQWVEQLHKTVSQPTLIMVVFTGRKDGGNGVCFIHLKRDFIT